jgi:hypothetical protein
MSALRAFTLRRLMVGAVVASGVSGCAISDVRDSIGRACVVDGDVCGTDHVCFVDDDDDDGLCAPVVDYGACDEPTYPVGAGEVAENDDGVIRVESAAELEDLDGVVKVEGNLFISPASAIGTIDVDSLCVLSGLQQVTGSVLISQTNLVTLDGLHSLSFVGKGIGIARNPELTDLMGLANLMRVVGPSADARATVVIANNLNLPEDAITEFRAALADRPSIRVFTCGNVRARAVDDAATCDAVSELIDR